MREQAKGAGALKSRGGHIGRLRQLSSGDAFRLLVSAPERDCSAIRFVAGTSRLNPKPHPITRAHAALNHDIHYNTMLSRN